MQSGFKKSNNSKKVIFLILALFVISLVSLIVILFSVLNSSTNKVEDVVPVVVEEPKQEIKMSQVLIPLKNLSAGTQLEMNQFRIESRPQISVDSRAVNGFPAIEGKFAKSLIVAGVPLLVDLVTTTRPISAISSSIPPGYRAVTIEVDKRSSVEGWAKPGSKVDVIWASKIRGEPAITTIVQNAKILSSNRQTQNGPAAEGEQQNAPAGPSTVTLLVTVKDAQKIQLATTAGSLSLSLRGDQDIGRAENGGSVTIDDLLGQSNKGAVQQKKYKGIVTLGGKKWGLDEDGQLIPIEKE
jgi:pilus assembly protein CpaB